MIPFRMNPPVHHYPLPDGWRLASSYVDDGLTGGHTETTIYHYSNPKLKTVEGEYGPRNVLIPGKDGVVIGAAVVVHKFTPGVRVVASGNVLVARAGDPYAMDSKPIAELTMTGDMQRGGLDELFKQTSDAVKFFVAGVVLGRKSRR